MLEDQAGSLHAEVEARLRIVAAFTPGIDCMFLSEALGIAAQEETSVSTTVSGSPFGIIKLSSIRLAFLVNLIDIVFHYLDTEIASTSPSWSPASLDRHTLAPSTDTCCRWRPPAEVFPPLTPPLSSPAQLVPQTRQERQQISWILCCTGLQGESAPRETGHPRLLEHADHGMIDTNSIFFSYKRIQACPRQVRLPLDAWRKPPDATVSNTAQGRKLDLYQCVGLKR